MRSRGCLGECSANLRRPGVRGPFWRRFPGVRLSGVDQPFDGSLDVPSVKQGKN